ncbi:MAG: hypothetical protein CME71_04995 [Halobacteriovorax sp.]|nr:hypothetical protein [Halobacteriovorax sp.]|tara:strand:+ start:490 stop:1074 length:585 start_codon:yes stop_codon:yes gene_type:complete
MSSIISSKDKSLEDFLSRLIYLGGNLGIKPKIKQYVDIEEFIVEATLFMDVDSRTTQCILNWIYFVSPYLSPSKLRRVLKMSEYNAKYLGQFVQVIESHSLNAQNWAILDEFVLKSEKIKFAPNFQKYLKTKPYIFKNCPELQFRMEGHTQVLADLKAYLKKNANFHSLYKIAKDTFNPRNRINYEYALLQYRL